MPHANALLDTPTMPLPAPRGAGARWPYRLAVPVMIGMSGLLWIGLWKLAGMLMALVG